MHDIHSAFVQKAIDKWNMTPILDSTPSTPGIVAAGTCEWCSIFVAISSPPNNIAIESIFTEEPASIVVDLNANSLALYAMSPIEARYIVAKNIPWNDDEFWSLHGDYLKFVYEIDKRFGKKNIESNFVRDFKKAFDLLDASWQNIGANAPTQQLTLTTLLRLLFIANIADRGALDGRKSFLFEAAADDAKVERTSRGSLLGIAERLTAPSEVLAVRRCRSREIAREAERVHTTLEARQVAKYDFRRHGGDRDNAAVPPVPRAASAFAEGSDDDAIDEDLELSRAIRRDPVARPHPKAVFACCREGDAGLCVGYGMPEAVSKQIARAHLVHKLLVDGPAAEIGKRLGLDKCRFRVDWRFRASEASHDCDSGN